MIMGITKEVLPIIIISSRNVIDTLKHRTSATTNALEGMKVVDIIERIYQVKDKK